MKLGEAFYLQKNVVKVAKSLIGKLLVTHIGGHCTSGIITETEAYNGIIDKASHAFGGRRTSRTEAMYKKGGVSYVYLCYGIHCLFNVVTHEENTPHAVLIRSIYPISGKGRMDARKGKDSRIEKMGVGPGNVSKCLGIDLSHNQLSLEGDCIWIERQDLLTIPATKINTGKRIGIDYAEEDADLPYRFWVDHTWVKQFLIENSQL
jgi:DNA-3-methyladenine glycosylase